jgi:hypothetical protein
VERILDQPITIAACDCVTPFGDARSTAAALIDGRIALQPQPVLGVDGGDPVPLALIDADWTETAPPRWTKSVVRLAAKIPGNGWGQPGKPVFVTSSNFGVGSLHAFQRTQQDEHLTYGVPHRSVAYLAELLGWGSDVTIVSHACVSAHLGLLLATRRIHAGLTEQALVFTFDFLSPFVTGGFHALKILNRGMPAPYAARDTGSIGLGDGAAFAVVSSASNGRARIVAQSLHNEMHHFTGNQPDGAGFARCFEPLARLLSGRRPWIKGHGTGTLDAGRLEAESCARLFPGAPLVSWKGSLGHTLGSCGLVELAVAIAARKAGSIPGTVASSPPGFADTVAFTPFCSRAMPLAERMPLSFSLMIERFLHAVHVSEATNESIEQTRERMKAHVPRASLRRMTQLGLLVSAVLKDVPLSEEDTIVYASTYAETRALEDYLASFPTPSPALFQTSIHPSAIEQALIGRNQPVRTFLPLSGGEGLVAQALLTTLLASAENVILVGGEERGTWLRERKLASERSFAFALHFRCEPGGAIGRLSLAAGDGDAAHCATWTFFDQLARRETLALSAMPGKHLQLSWLA